MTKSGDHTQIVQLSSGIADFARAFIGKPPRADDNRWAFRVSPGRNLQCVGQYGGLRREKLLPNLSRIARYLTYKEVGIAMSSGAARGFAHLGVLDVLDQHGVPFDVLCGSSMGGIVALTLARKGSVTRAIGQIRDKLGSNKKVRDPALLRREAHCSRGEKIKAAALDTFGDCTFADLSMPTAVVAADLASGERVILDRGPVIPAILGTSAIPGFFPPITHKSLLLVDGGVVSWVPVDVLGHHRCGLRIAINVLSVDTRL